MGLGQGIRLGQVPQESRGYHGGGGGGWIYRSWFHQAETTRAAWFCGAGCWDSLCSTRYSIRTLFLFYFILYSYLLQFLPRQDSDICWAGMHRIHNGTRMCVCTRVHMQYTVL